MGSAVFFTIPRYGTFDKTNILPRELFGVNGSLLLDEKPLRGKKKKKNNHLVVTNRRCCLLLWVYNDWLAWGLEKWTPGAFYCFHISQGKRNLFPTAVASSTPFRLEQRWGGDGEGKQMEQRGKKRTLIILVLSQIQETCEGPAHQKERFPLTLLHIGQPSECTA